MLLLVGLSGAVRRENRVRGEQQGRVGGQRLGLEHVEPGAAQRAGHQQLGQRGLVDLAAAGHVDDDGAARKQGQLAVAEQPVVPGVREPAG